MNNAKQLAFIARICRRQLSQTTEKVAPRFQRLKELQKKFQVDDGTPIYIKTGYTDKILYIATTVLTFVGLGLSAETMYKLSFPKAN